MSSANRTIRYGAPVLTVIVGVLFAAVETNSLGNTVSLVLIGGGLIWFMTTLGRDMGMTASTGRTPRVPDPPSEGDGPGRDRNRPGNGNAGAGVDSDAAAGPDATGGTVSRRAAPEPGPHGREG